MGRSLVRTCNPTGRHAFLQLFLRFRPLFFRRIVVSSRFRTSIGFAIFVVPFARFFAICISVLVTSHMSSFSQLVVPFIQWPLNTFPMHVCTGRKILLFNIGIFVSTAVFALRVVRCSSAIFRRIHSLSVSSDSCNNTWTLFSLIRCRKRLNTSFARRAFSVQWKHSFFRHSQSSQANYNPGHVPIRSRVF